VRIAKQRSIGRTIPAHFNGRITLVEGVGYQTAVTVEAEGQLGHVVRADGEAVKVLQELFCQYTWQSLPAANKTNTSVFAVKARQTIRTLPNGWFKKVSRAYRH
jgi:hypothetical protein